MHGQDLRECPMFQGRYDAINGNPYFMSGIETVMEVIANRACDWMFGWRDDKYLPTGDQIVWMAEHNDVSCETLWSMFEKLEGENQNGKQMP